MKKKILSVCMLLVIGYAQAQKEKIKGNKIVTTEQKTISGFHTIDLYDNFEVILHEDTDNLLKIEADSNLHEVIQASVQDSILTIKCSKSVKRPKALNIKISYAQALRKITIHDKAHLTSVAAIKSSSVRVESSDNAEVKLTVEADKLTNITNGKASVELNATAKNSFYQVNESSKLKGIITTDSLKIDLYQKGNAKLEGKTELLQLRADSATHFYGQKLASEDATVIAEGSTDCFVQNNKTITIDAKDDAEVYIISENTNVTVNNFANEATLYRKKLSYSPGIF